VKLFSAISLLSILLLGSATSLAASHPSSGRTTAALTTRVVTAAAIQADKVVRIVEGTIRTRRQAITTGITRNKNKNWSFK